jgi:hypothetical protein
MVIPIRRIALILAALFVAGMVCTVPASAQATRTWVSGVGDDNNPCSRTLPCKTFGNTIAKTAAGGEINCLDPGGYGAVTITKSISIICDTVFGSVLISSGTSGIIINVPAGTYVTLSGFTIDGLGSGVVSGIDGVRVLQGGNISLRNMTITGFRDGSGVDFEPTAAAQLIMSNVTITESGSTQQFDSDGGVYVRPAAGVTATVMMNNSRVQNNNNAGVRFDTIGSVGSTIIATMDNSVVSNNSNGVLAKSPAGTGTIKLLVNHSIFEENAGTGLIVNGTGSTVRVTNSTVSQNGTGLLTLSSGTVVSYGNNVFDGNVIDGGPATISLRTQ